MLTVAGRKQSVDIVIHNTGSMELMIKLSSMQPTDDVEFERDVIDCRYRRICHCKVYSGRQSPGRDYVVKFLRRHRR